MPVSSRQPWSELPGAPLVGARRRIPAWLLSLALHLGIFVALGLVLHATPEGAVLEPDRTGGIVLVRATDRSVEYLSRDDLTAQAEPAPGAPAEFLPDSVDLSDALVALPELPAALPGMSALGGAVPGAEELARGHQPQRSVEGKGTTSVFGLAGSGTRFVYVFDRSGSMAGFQGRPLAAAKAELIASVRSLEPTHQFQIIFYNEEPRVFNPQYPQRPQMVFADSRGKALAERFVRGIIASGGTEHMGALRMALGLQPDVIFFLTDADEPQLRPDELREIHLRNQRVGATIHAIEFAAGPRRGTGFLARLAQQNGGEHAYVDVTQLRSDP